MINYLSYFLWLLAAVMSSVQDTVKFRFHKSIFDSYWLEGNFPRFYAWLRSYSRDRYLDPDNLIKKKLFWFVPVPDQLADLWHFSKFLKWVFLYAAMISFYFNNILQLDVYQIIRIGLIYGVIMWVGFMIPFNILLIKKRYWVNPFSWFIQFLR